MFFNYLCPCAKYSSLTVSSNFDTFLSYILCFVFRLLLYIIIRPSAPFHISFALFIYWFYFINACMQWRQVALSCFTRGKLCADGTLCSPNIAGKSQVGSLPLANHSYTRKYAIRAKTGYGGTVLVAVGHFACLATRSWTKPRSRSGPLRMHTATQTHLAMGIR